MTIDEAVRRLADKKLQATYAFGDAPHERLPCLLADVFLPAGNCRVALAEDAARGFYIHCAHLLAEGG